mgnify:CR=1 FL=1
MVAVSIVFNDSDLSPQDRWFLDHLSGRELALCVQHTPRGTRLILYDETAPHVLSVTFPVAQVWLDYLKTFGMPQRPGFPRLPAEARSGSVGPNDAPIPTDAWLAGVLDSLGPDLVNLTASWSAPLALIHAVEQGTVQGPAAVSRLSWNFVGFLLGQVPIARPTARRLRHVGVYLSEPQIAWLRAHGGASRAVRMLIDRAMADGSSPETPAKTG